MTEREGERGVCLQKHQVNTYIYIIYTTLLGLPRSVSLNARQQAEYRSVINTVRVVEAVTSEVSFCDESAILTCLCHFRENIIMCRRVQCSKCHKATWAGMCVCVRVCVCYTSPKTVHLLLVVIYANVCAYIRPLAPIYIYISISSEGSNRMITNLSLLTTLLPSSWKSVDPA